MPIFSILQHHADAVTSSLFGGAVALSQATGAAPPLPDGAPWWAGYLISLAIATAPVVVVRILSAWAAGKEADAAGKREIAKELLNDSNPDNDADALALFARARKLEAEAASLRALGSADSNTHH